MFTLASPMRWEKVLGLKTGYDPKVPLACRELQPYLPLWFLSLPSMALPQAQKDEGEDGQGQLILQNGCRCQARS